MLSISHYHSIAVRLAAQRVAFLVSGLITLLLAANVGCDSEIAANNTLPVESNGEVEEPAPLASSTNTPKQPSEHSKVPPKQPAVSRLLDKTFDDIKFDIEPDAPFDRSMLTEDIEQLFGQRIRIRGYIFPTFQRKGITQFVLVRDNQECCFGAGAALYDCIRVEMLPGKSAEFSVRPVSVEGTFAIDEYVDFEGVIRAIYYMDGELVK